MSLALLLACGGPGPATLTPPGVTPAAVTAATSNEVRTAGGRYTLTWATDASPLPFNALFSVRSVLRDRSGAPVTNGSVVVDASMPQHGHGMSTHPIANPGVCLPTPQNGPLACTHPDGVYVSDGMKFHMAGEWVLHFDVAGPLGDDTADVHYTL